MSTLDYEKKYRDIVSAASQQAIGTMQKNAAHGDFVPLVLHYKTEQLGLFPSGAAHANGWTPSTHVLGISHPYSSFWAWIYEHARRLPIYA